MVFISPLFLALQLLRIGRGAANKADTFAGVPRRYNSGLNSPERFAQTVVLATLDQNVGLPGD